LKVVQEDLARRLSHVHVPVERMNVILWNQHPAISSDTAEMVLLTPRVVRLVYSGQQPKMNVIGPQEYNVVTDQ